MPRTILSALLLSAISGCVHAAVPTTTVDVQGQYPHDTRAFTEGLLIADQTLYESTGQYGRSTLRRINLSTGRVEKQRRLINAEFGEGLARYGNRLYQLTWKAGVVHVYDLDSLKPVARLTYHGEGWGLATCGNQLIMSNGSDTLFFRDPATFRIVRKLSVTEDGRRVDQINELEVIHGLIWANQWLTDRILIIDPENGHVVQIIDARALAARQPKSADVLNGIAFDAATDRVFITGKYWPALYTLASHSTPENGSDQKRSARARCQSAR